MRRTRVRSRPFHAPTTGLAGAVCLLLLLAPSAARAEPIGLAAVPEAATIQTPFPWRANLPGGWDSLLGASAWGEGTPGHEALLPTSGLFDLAPAADLDAVLAPALGLPSWAASPLGGGYGGAGAVSLMGAPPSALLGGDMAFAPGACGPGGGAPAACPACAPCPWWLLVPLAFVPLFFLLGDDSSTEVGSFASPAPSPVPEPASLLLVGAGLSTAAGLGRRGRRAAHPPARSPRERLSRCGAAARP